MKMFFTIIFCLLTIGSASAEKYLPNNAINMRVSDIYGIELLEKERVFTSGSDVMSASFIKTELHAKDDSSHPSIRARREALVSAIQISTTKKVSVDEETNLFGRVGIYNYQIETLAKRYADQNNPTFHWGKISKETAPIASIGIESKSFLNFLFRAEYQIAGSVTAGTLAVLYNFE